MFLGENPPLPPELIAELRQRTRDTRSWVTEQFWDIVAANTVAFFEGQNRQP